MAEGDDPASTGPPGSLVEHPDLARIVGRIERQTEEMVALTSGLEPELFAARPEPTRWSPAEHLAHLALVTGPYARAVREGVGKARRKGWTDPPERLKGSRLGRWMIRQMEPPPRRRFGTLRKLEPPPEIDRAEAVADFRAVQEELAAAVRDGDGLDLGRLRVSSPFLFLLRAPAFQMAGLAAAHTDRHIWLVREALGREG